MKHLPPLILILAIGCAPATQVLDLADVPADALPEWADPLDVTVYEIDPLGDDCRTVGEYVAFYGDTGVPVSGVPHVSLLAGAGWSDWFVPSIEVAPSCDVAYGGTDALLVDGVLYLLAYDFRDGGVDPVVSAVAARVMVGG